MQIAVISGATTRKLTRVGITVSTGEGDESYPLVSSSIPTPSTTRCTGTTTAADSARKARALRK